MYLNSWSTIKFQVFKLLLSGYFIKAREKVIQMLVLYFWTFKLYLLQQVQLFVEVIHSRTPMSQWLRMLACTWLNENCPHHNRYFNIWSTGGGIIWERSVGVHLLSKVHHWEPTLRFQDPTPFLVFLTLPHICFLRCELSATTPTPWLPSCCHAPHHNDHGFLALWNCKHKTNSFCYKLSYSFCLVTTESD